VYRKPLVREIEYIDPVRLLPALAQERALVFLDSATNKQPFEDTNRYSYLGFDPAERIEIQNSASDSSPLAQAKEKIRQYKMEKAAGIPPFQGGLMGCFGYELLHAMEDIPRPQSLRPPLCPSLRPPLCPPLRPPLSLPLHPPLRPPLYAEDPDQPTTFPDLLAGIYDVIVAWDHQEKKAWVVSTGYPVQDEAAAENRAKNRLNEVLNKVLECQRSEKPPAEFQAVSVEKEVSESAYLRWVKQAKEYILSGDIFEVNLSQRFFATLVEKEQVLSLYLQLRKKNPAPFSCFLQFDSYAIASASPERFLRVNSGGVETRPIKGTIARLADRELDSENKKKLLASEKDRAENTMIVDLMRNDLSRVCEADSVVVDKLCGLESTESVHHLVSVVSGQLQSGFDAFDLFEAAFPAGSITGAPKIRAMQIIAELEIGPRGPYCGSLGWFGFSGDMDTSIVIRSIVIEGKRICFQAGGAVVLDSDPQGEYKETLLKAKKCKEALVAPS
jgi:para-aminobenzoate synthetase component I